MPDYISTPYSDELYHHGIKGQKWGVRRTAAELGHKVASAVKKYRTDRYEKNKTNAILSGDTKKIKKYLKTMSTNEINEATNRANAISRLNDVDKMSKGMKFVKKATNIMSTGKDFYDKAHAIEKIFKDREADKIKEAKEKKERADKKLQDAINDAVNSGDYSKVEKYKDQMNMKQWASFDQVAKFKDKWEQSAKDKPLSDLYNSNSNNTHTFEKKIYTVNASDLKKSNQWQYGKSVESKFPDDVTLYEAKQKRNRWNY